MATNLFSKAAAYRKKHPGMTMPEAVKAVSKGAGKKKPAAKKKATRKKAAPRKKAAAKKTVGKVRKKKAAPRKIKLKIKPGKKGIFNLGISGVSMSKISQEHQHQAALNNAMAKHQGMLKEKGLTAREKVQIRRDISHYKNAIAASKKHISALKRSI